ncbi:MAG: urea ABC transporter permease subunit UrtB, partial [Ensifer adhaerens]
LFSADAGARLKAAQSMRQTPSADALEAIETALAAEKDAAVRKTLDEARAVTLLVSDRSDDDKRAAIKTLAESGGREALGALTSALSSADGSLKPDIEAALQRIEQAQAFWNAGQNVWYGLSLGSVLLLAAIGLAITFGVMGIINMAHGEMVMLGAYTTFLVQDVIRDFYPALFDWSLAIALPLAFLVTGVIGLAIERSVIRFLYGRPLETLLATWGISLILQQSVRSIFGPTNREVGNPSWMAGAFELGGLTITWNRLWIIVFALAVFAALLFLLKRTSMGLRMRAVTQNRRMASSMGIRTPWVDALTFALGSGIAGMAGVALSQIDNVSPNLGQGYIIDSFMVVVFGGVGNLWGTLVGAFSLGILNKFLEPYAGAVLGKILVLVLIILFIQKKPRGLFALKGRAVEA